MKKFVRLIMLVVLLCSTILVPFSYANVENLGESGGILDNSGEVPENEGINLDNENVVEGDNETIETEVGDGGNGEVPSLQSTLDDGQIVLSSEKESDTENEEDSISTDASLQSEGDDAEQDFLLKTSLGGKTDDNEEDKTILEGHMLRNAPKNNCGNGIIDEGEDCKTCPEDVGGCSEDPIQLFRQGTLSGTYTSLSQAIAEAQDGDVVYLLQDISVTGASVVSGKSLTINGNNHKITRDADITTFTVNENSSLELVDITITDNAVNFAPNRYDSLINAKSNIPLCLGGVNETKDENGEVTESVCDTTNVDTAKTHPQIYSVGDIYGDNLTISNSLNSQGSAAIIVEKGGIEMVNSNFIHNGASGTSNAGRGGAIRVGPNTAANIVDESPITKILFSGCYFESNYGRMYGGAIAIHYAPEVITVDNCIFSGNTAYSNGGAIQILNIWYKLGGSNASFWISSGSNFPIGTMYVNNSEFYNNWCGNDGAAIENDDINLEVNGSNFEHNYGTQPLNTSVGVISCQAGSDEGGGDKTGRGGIYREYKIKNSFFKDTNTSVFGDHNAMGAFFIDNCSFEKQSKVILTYNGRGEIKNSIIKNSNLFNNCGITGSMIRDFDIVPYSDYLDRMAVFGESTFKLENNTYINDCTTNEYFQIRNINFTTGENNIIVENEDNTKIFVHLSYYDSANIEGTDEIYYGVTIVDGGKGAYIKKNKFYNFDEFHGEIKKFSSRGGYQLDSGKTMLFYLDSGHTELWSGSISTTTNLYGKEMDIHNITYEGMEGVNLEGIAHTYNFNKLNHTQYLTELTPYTLNTPSRNGYKFEGRYLDSEYKNPVTTISAGSTGDITLYAKWQKVYNRSGGGGRRSENNPDNNPDVKGDKKGNNHGLANEQDPSIELQDNEVVDEEVFDMHQRAYDNGLTIYKPGEDAKLDQPLTRQQMAKISSIFAQKFLNQKVDDSERKIMECSQYEDLNRIYGEMKGYVIQSCLLGNMGYRYNNVEYISKFKPYDKLTVDQASVILSRMIWGNRYVLTSKLRYQGHMYAVYEKGLIDDISNPNRIITREEAFLMLYRVYQKMEK